RPIVVLRWRGIILRTPALGVRIFGTFVLTQEQSLYIGAGGFKFGACGFRSRWLQQIAAAGHGNPASASHFKHAERPQHFEQAIDLVHGARNFNDERFRSYIDDTRAENLDQFHQVWTIDRKSTRLNSSHVSISYAVFCLKK